MTTRNIRLTGVEIENDARLDALEADHSVGFNKLPTATTSGFIGSFVSGNYRHIGFGAGFSISGSGSTFTLRLPQAPAGFSLWGAGQAGDYERIQLGSGLTMTGTPGSLVLTASGSALADADYGDIIVSTVSGNKVFTIDPTVLTAGGRALIGQSWTSGTEVWALTGASTVTKLRVGATNATDLLDKQSADARYALIGSGGSGNLNSVATRTALASITGMANGDLRYLSEAGREGWFKFSTANLSTQVTNDPGQGVYVAPSAASTGASGAWVRTWSTRLIAKWFGATGDGTTNDLTAAQRAVALCDFLGGGEVHFPDGFYFFGTGSLTIPAYTGSQWRRIKITGAGCVQEFGTALSFTMPTTGTVLQSNATSGAVISATATSGGSTSPFTNYIVFIEDLTVRTYNNPSCSGVDMGNALSLVMRNVQIDTAIYSNSVTAWSTTTSYGLITPANNNAALTECYNVAVSGYYAGIQMNEHANIVGGNVTGCANALWYLFGNHSSWYQGKLQNNVQNFVIAGACVFSAHVNIEHAASGAQVTTADIKDVGSLCVKGEIVWSIVKQLAGQDTTFIRNGGLNIIDRRVGTYPSTPTSLYLMSANLSVSNNLDTAITFVKINGGSETSLHAGDATKIDINTSGTYRVTINGTWAANATGQRQIAVDHHHGVIDVIAKATQDATAGGIETCQSATSMDLPFSGGVGEYLQMLVNQNSGGALNFLGGVNRSGGLTIEKLA